MNTVKAILAFSCIVITYKYVEANPLQQNPFQILQECKNQENVEFIDGIPDENDPKLGCLADCILKKKGEMNDSGEIVISKFPEHLQNVAKNCSEQKTEGDRCTRAGYFTSCVRSYLRESFRKQADECAKETNVEVAVNDWRELSKFSQDDKYACFVRCLMIKAKRMNEKNEFTFEEKFEGVGIETINKCIKENQQEDVCIQAARRGFCVIKAFFNFRDNGKVDSAD